MKNANKITYESFTERVANRAKVSDGEADAYIHQFSEITGDALEDGDEVQLYRFGRFVTVHVEERSGHNPGTGDEIIIPEHSRVDFRPYQALLTAVNWPFRHLRTRMLSEDENNRRPSTLVWLLLLLALIPIGFAINSWMSGPDTNLANPIPAAVSKDLPLAQASPIANSNQTAIIDPVIAEPVIVDPVIAEPVIAETVVTEDARNLANIVPAEPYAETTRSIVVDRGDTLYQIAATQWGDSSLWPLIYAENRVELTRRNPDLIAVGSTLRLPMLPGRIAPATDVYLRQKTDAYKIVADDYTSGSNMRAAEYRVAAARGFGSVVE